MVKINDKGFLMWKNDSKKKVFNEIEESVDMFFEKIYMSNVENRVVIPSNDLIYREGQHNFALDVIDALRNNKILLIQGGVGVGKSYGYLIPIFYTYAGTKDEKNIKFSRFLISTSNIALQHQLMRDIDKISKMIDIPVKATVAKGVNNYACVKRIENILNSSFEDKTDEKNRIREILSLIEEKDSCDREDLGEISDKIWRKIQLCGRGYCSNCTYSRNCNFRKIEEKIKDSNIIITNHANYISNFKKMNVDALVIDEAHKWDENVINILTKKIRLYRIYVDIDDFGSFFIYNTYNNEDAKKAFSSYLKSVKTSFSYLFAYIRRSATNSFNSSNRNDNSVVDGDRMSFVFNKDILSLISKIQKEIKKILSMIENTNPLDKKGKDIKEELINKFKCLDALLSDMLDKKTRKNIYWTNFFNEDNIEIGYVPKNRTDITKMIADMKIPVVYTSATLLDVNDSYSYFMNRNGLDLINRTIEQAEEQISPYDYDNNALFYYDKNVPVPNKKEENILDLALKIGELIRITNGKALVLFTSKERMKDVYDLMTRDEFPFKILLQDDNNADEIGKEFESDTNTCLFATGSFWEGVSFKGKTLSNLIITHLPFNNVDAINKYEAGKYINKHEKMQHVYIPEMLTKMEQAIGRLIRDDNDTGIVCCLDSRMENYLEEIRRISPIKNITTNIDEVYRFSDEKITNCVKSSNVKTRVKVIEE